MADFFLHLFDRVGLAAATIRTFKVAILSALEPRQSFLTSQLAILNKLLNSFHKRKPPKSSPVPDLDIGLVLKVFSLPSFGPIQQASVEALTYKALVLVILALEARRGELIALRQDRNSFAQRRTGLLCYYIPICLSCPPLKQQGAGSLRSLIS